MERDVDVEQGRLENTYRVYMKGSKRPQGTLKGPSQNQWAKFQGQA